MKTWAIALNTFREAIRNKILYSVVFFAAFLVGVSALFGSVTIGDQVKVIKDFGLFSLSLFGAVATIISGVSFLNKELKQKTIYNVLSKPVHRWQFIVGKYLGIVLSVAMLLTIMALGLITFVSLYTHTFDVSLLVALLFTILEMSVVAAVCMFFSALVVTPTLSGLFTFATYLAGRSFASLAYFLTQGEGYNPALAGVVRVFQIILPDLSVFNWADRIVYGIQIPPAVLLNAGIYAISYSVIALVFAVLIFSRRELV